MFSVMFELPTSLCYLLSNRIPRLKVNSLQRYWLPLPLFDIEKDPTSKPLQTVVRGRWLARHWLFMAPIAVAVALQILFK